MPGLLRDRPGRSNSGRRANITAQQWKQCVDSQEWLLRKYDYLRRELDDVDRQLTRIRRLMERRASQRTNLLEVLQMSTDSSDDEEEEEEGEDPQEPSPEEESKPSPGRRTISESSTCE